MVSFFSRKKKDEESDEQPSDENAIAESAEQDADAGDDKSNKKDKKEKKKEEEPERDPRKAQKFFKHAQTVADSRQYDYAIECYINGLRWDPESLDHHEALREVAMKRLGSGGKKAGMMEAMKHGGGKNALEKMLNAEYLWAKEPRNGNIAVKVCQHATKSELFEIAFWVGEIAMELCNAMDKPKKYDYLDLTACFEEMHAYRQAVDACRRALRLDQNNTQLQTRLRDLETERTMAEGGYNEAGEGKDAFRKSVRNMDKQREAEQDESIALSADEMDNKIERLRKQYQEDAENWQEMLKLVQTLQAKQTTDTDKEAIQLLTNAYQKTNEYRYKVRIGDIKIKYFQRKQTQLKAQMKDGVTDELKVAYKKVTLERLKFELVEFAERVKNYPTENGLKYELATRQFQAKDYDGAIGNFQQAMSDPKFRANAQRYLGESFAAKGWHDEAIDTYRDAISGHHAADDKLGLELRYSLMTALSQKAEQENNQDAVKEAVDLGSAIARTNINYKDIRQRLDAARKLADKIRGGS